MSALLTHLPHWKQVDTFLSVMPACKLPSIEHGGSDFNASPSLGSSSNSQVCLELSTCVQPACCRAQIDVHTGAFVFSLATSESIFLAFFYLSSHSLPLCPPHSLLCQCSSPVHLYSPQMQVLFFFLPSPSWLFSSPSFIFLHCPTSLTGLLNYPPPLSPQHLIIVTPPTAAPGPSFVSGAPS